MKSIIFFVGSINVASDWGVFSPKPFTARWLRQWKGESSIENRQCDCSPKKTSFYEVLVEACQNNSSKIIEGVHRAINEINIGTRWNYPAAIIEIEVMTWIIDRAMPFICSLSIVVFTNVRSILQIKNLMHISTAVVGKRATLRDRAPVGMIHFNLCN